MKKFKVLLTGVTTMLVALGTAFTISAATKGITATVTTSMASATYTYGKPCSSIKVIVYYKEKHNQTNHVYESTFDNYAYGGYESISASKGVDTGYVYTEIKADGYCNGEFDITTGTVEP